MSAVGAAGYGRRMDRVERRAPWGLWDKDSLLVGFDVVVGVLVTIPAMLAVFEAPHPEYPTFTGWLRVAAVVVALSLGLPLAVRRRWPLPVLGVVTVAAAAADLLQVVSGASGITAYALYMVAREEPRRRSVPAYAVSMAAIAVVLALVPVVDVHDVPPQYGWTHAIIGWVLCSVGWVLGWMVRRHRELSALAEAQAARQDHTDRRLHLAREVHDVVAHNLSVITVKAGVALHVAEQRPEEAVETLRVIERTGRTALAEVRQLLEALRRTEAEAPAGDPGLADLPELVTRAEASGVRVTVPRHDLPALPGGMELSVYRIVAEALTNVVKHAAPADCEVLLRLDDGWLRIDVTDNGTAHALPAGGLPGGHGLTGIRERVEAYGGEFAAGPRPGGGFALSARLPYEREEAR